MSLDDDFLKLRNPISIAIPVLARIENINAPIAQIPIVTPTSTRVGKYSAIFPQGPGINPGTIKPNPFSTKARWCEAHPDSQFAPQPEASAAFKRARQTAPEEYVCSIAGILSEAF